MSEENQVQLEDGDVVEELENNLDEASAAAATLKPSATKSAMLTDLMSKVAGMTKQDLSSFLDKTLAQVGKEADSVPDTSGKNKASVANSGAGVPSPRVAVPAKAMKEDMDELLADQEDLSEEFKAKATTIFEAAVQNRAILEMTRIEEEFEAKLEEQVSASVEELHEQVNQYMDYVVEKWMEENHVALENNFRVEATEHFIDGLKTLFAESYVEVPEEKIDMVEQLVSTVAELEAKLDVVESNNIELNRLNNEACVNASFDKISEGLVQTQIEKLRSLAEGIDYTDALEYGEKLKIIKEQYFTESTKKEDGSTGLINEEVSVGANDDEEDAAVRVSPEMQHYFNAIQSTIRK
jgi:hypothetical protein